MDCCESQTCSHKHQPQQFKTGSNDDWLEEEGEDGKSDFKQMERQMHDTGYKEGRSEGKDLGLQQGFKLGLLSGVPVGFFLGQIEGMLKTLVTFSTKEGQFQNETERISKLSIELEDIQTQCKTAQSFSKTKPSPAEWANTQAQILQKVRGLYEQLGLSMPVIQSLTLVA